MKSQRGSGITNFFLILGALATVGLLIVAMRKYIDEPGTLDSKGIQIFYSSEEEQRAKNAKEILSKRGAKVDLCQISPNCDLGEHITNPKNKIYYPVSDLKSEARVTAIKTIDLLNDASLSYDEFPLKYHGKYDVFIYFINDEDFLNRPKQN